MLRITAPNLPKTLVLVIAMFSLTVSLQSCAKNGCTDILAENYDADATKDDGTCNERGCTDATASNYNPNAIDDDGSCLIGHTVFHLSPASAEDVPLQIYLDGVLKGELRAKMATATCDFDDNTGELTIKMPVGTYTLGVGPNQKQVGTVNFVEASCGGYLIN